ncbi:HlyD family efflux transporter periplasmic adaptor subunit [Rhodopirellula halodulae]|uniref:HlyD family efflux transporter periplasmic adaptor subunit n=1 Tax=Rhodopirellula halodulae TaxID=2894198 RepID=UPI001E4C91A4|nr:HlyD family efflux transporter periplasmic adaptor subunit [Rhodopirellula sp. JC737]MCC9656861.1 HlyD family efflux transporter periplasmic adaptor subunit [Rhodopirellula sp. JC737]
MSAPLAQATRFRLRPDLICRPIQIGRTIRWVIRDPFRSKRKGERPADEQWMLDEEELAILQSFDGKRSVDEAYKHCRRLLAPSLLARDSFRHFVADADRHGWLDAGRDPGQLEVGGGKAAGWQPALRDAASRQAEAQQTSGWQSARRWGRRLGNPFAIRIPLIDPDPWLTWVVHRLTPFVRPYRRLLVAIAVGWLSLSGVVLVTHWERLWMGMQQTVLDFSTSWHWLGFVVLVSTAKVFHELAHAFACKAFGGRCNEMGIMLLFGIPCLYCDVSDAWLFRQPWKRMLVSGAGILAEIGISTVALLAWSLAMPGFPRDILCLLIVITSVNTLILNGNPLMRYDGYYLLSDAIGVPNLASRSRAGLQRRLRSLIWGIKALQQDDEQIPALELNDSRSLGMVGYALLSGLYRLVVFGGLAWFLLGQLGSIGAKLLAITSIFAICAFIGRRWLSAVLQAPINSQSKTPKWRPALMISSFCLAAAALGFVPLPNSIRGTASLQPIQQTEIIVTSEGQLNHVRSAETKIAKDELIAELTNWKASLKELQLEGEIAELRATLQGQRIHRVVQTEVPTSTLTLPTLETALRSKQQQLATLRTENERRQLVAPHAGRLVTSPLRHTTLNERTFSQISWSGHPTDPINRGAWMPTGTSLCRIVGDKGHRVEMQVPATDIGQVRVGQTARFQIFTGRTAQASVSNVASQPDQESGNYLVTLQLNSDNALMDVQPPMNASVKATIDGTPMSVWKRVTRWFASNFRLNQS